MVVVPGSVVTLKLPLTPPIVSVAVTSTPLDAEAVTRSVTLSPLTTVPAAAV